MLRNGKSTKCGEMGLIERARLTIGARNGKSSAKKTPPSRSVSVFIADGGGRGIDLPPTRAPAAGYQLGAVRAESPSGGAGVSFFGRARERYSESR